MYKKIKVLSFALAISLFLFGCEKSTASSKKEDITVQIGIQQGLSPLLLAQKKDGLKKNLKKKGLK